MESYVLTSSIYFVQLPYLEKLSSPDIVDLA